MIKAILPPPLMVWRWIPWPRKRHCPACGDETMRVGAPWLLRSVELLGAPYRRCRRCSWKGFDLAGWRSDGADAAGGAIPLDEWMRAATLTERSAAPPEADGTERAAAAEPVQAAAARFSVTSAEPAPATDGAPDAARATSESAARKPGERAEERQPQPHPRNRRRGRPQISPDPTEA